MYAVQEQRSRSRQIVVHVRLSSQKSDNKLVWVCIITRLRYRHDILSQAHGCIIPIGAAGQSGA